MMESGDYRPNFISKFRPRIKTPSRNIANVFHGIEALKVPNFKISFLGSKPLEPFQVGQTKQCLQDVGYKSPQPTKVTLAMVLTNIDDEIVDSKDVVPVSRFESKDVNAWEVSKRIDDKDYSVILLRTKSHHVDIIRATNLYVDGATPHCVHLPSELWQSIAKSEDDIRDFGTRPPICSAIIGKDSDRTGSELDRNYFDPMYQAPAIDLTKHKFGVHLKPLPGKNPERACIFLALRQP